MERFVKVKLAVWSTRFHPETWLRSVIQKNRHTAIFHALRRDLHIGPVDWRRGNGVRPQYPLALDHPLEGQELSWLSTKPSFLRDLEAERLCIVCLLLGLPTEDSSGPSRFRGRLMGLLAQESGQYAMTPRKRATGSAS